MSRLIVVPIGCMLVASFVLSFGVGQLTAQAPATAQAAPQSAQGSATQGSDAKPAGQATPVVPTATVEEEPDPETLAAKASYILGYNTAKKMVTDLGRQGIDVNKEQMLVGIQNAMGEMPSKYSPAEVKTILGAYQKLLQKQQQAKMEKESTENKAAGEAYQKEFAAKEGVKKIDNGIQYVVVKSGDGEALDPAEKVMVHYTGKFTDGTVFDTSLEPKRGRPVAPVPMAVSGARLIPAFGQVLPLMKVGSKWEVCIPAAQAYGVRGSGPRGPIGPNETLVFEIEVLEKVKAPAAKVVNPAAAEKAGSAAK